MPNWCSNTVMIQGEPDEVQKVLDTINVEGTAFNFNAIIKMPEALQGSSAPEKDSDKAEENLRLYGAKDWYDWANLNWGTKWNVDARIAFDQDGVMLPGNRTVKIEFDSAWAPPMPVYQTLAARFPNTNIYICYDEPGVGFSGWAMYKDGKCVLEKEYSESFEYRRRHLDPTEEIFEDFPEGENLEEVNDHAERTREAWKALHEQLASMKLTTKHEE